MISAVGIANTNLKNAAARVDKAVEKFATASKSAAGPAVKDVIEFNSAGHAFKASAKVAKMANQMLGTLMDIKS
ncbi:MAG: hypothetical protein QF449_13580 [Alphaproteobacteria bacterium]|jgi:hypothetical protein|nr:hypothetical protein [Alphaproteobacteria bacterium]MDP6591146.1 hypothetical protein [Alphaproteobacteria bacterium]MDP6819054.1 hypothetical protein [Alphaproteobacteria bacterium]